MEPPGVDDKRTNIKSGYIHQPLFRGENILKFFDSQLIWYNDYIFSWKISDWYDTTPGIHIVEEAEKNHNKLPVWRK